MEGTMDMHEQDYILGATPKELQKVRTTSAMTSEGRPFDHMVRGKVASGEWRLECVRPDVLGLDRPLEIYRAVRKANLIKPWPASDDAESYCPAHWADLAIGRGACGFRCRACFLMLTHRLFCDPSLHVVYENVEDSEKAVRRWLQKPTRCSVGLPIVALCKEPRSVRRAVGLDHEMCNCG
jgi:hypothetical protein